MRGETQVHAHVPFVTKIRGSDRARWNSGAVEEGQTFILIMIQFFIGKHRDFSAIDKSPRTKLAILRQAQRERYTDLDVVRVYTPLLEHGRDRRV